MKSETLQTMIVIGIAASAVVGALSGAVTSLFIGDIVSPDQFFNPQATVLSEQAMQSKIVELIEEESATIAVVERVTPAVVSIVVKKERGQTRSSNPYYNSFFYSSLTEEEAAELVEVSSGTGFFVTEDGYLLTNRHVVDESDAQFFVVTNEGEELPAELIDIDPFQDIAILRAQGSNFATVSLGDSEQIRIGQTVIAIGNTLSEFRNTVTKGVISGIDRRVTAGDAFSAEVIEQAIQTDAAINPGNSGGPLINLLGEVIAINTAVSYEGESVAFAIPINEAKRAINDVQEYGRIIRPWLGVRYVLVQPDGDTGGIDYEVGALIVEGGQPGESGVFEGSPADLAGLKENDVIISIDGAYLSQDAALSEVIAKYHPEDVVTVGIIRDNAFLELAVTLAEYTQ